MKAFYLYLIILLEGYVVLSTELVAIRQLVPFVGNGTETVAIIIAAVLMPLSFGYYSGGNYQIKNKGKKHLSIRNKLIKNVINSAVILVLGISYILLEIYFGMFEALGIKHRVLQATIFSMIFMVYPVYLLGQTVPLVSNYFRGSNLSKATGTILTFSTIGSFVGATFSTLVLMATIGVHNVIIVNIALLVVVVFILNKKTFSYNNILIIFILLASYGLNGEHMFKSIGIVEDNNYSLIVIQEGEEEGTKILNINRSSSAKFSENPDQRFPYLRFMEERFIDTIANNKANVPPKSILVIGAGGFTFGQDDGYNEYTYVDIDYSLKDVVEEHFFERKLKDNHKFEAIPARAFLNKTDKKFDVILLDAYTNVISIPFQLITKEFFEQVKDSLNDDGVMLFNAIVSPNFEDRFSVKLDNTIRQVFNPVNRQVASWYNGWTGKNEAGRTSSNVIYSYRHRDYSKDDYTDNVNTYYLDR